MARVPKGGCSCPNKPGMAEGAREPTGPIWHLPLTSPAALRAPGLCNPTPTHPPLGTGAALGISLLAGRDPAAPGNPDWARFCLCT